jgi:aminopeptidase N
MVPPYQEDQGWTIHDPWIFGEYLVYPAADFEINLETDAEDLVVAASAAPLDGEVGSQYALESARNFVFSISPSYQTLEAAAGETEIVGYFFPGYQVPGQAAVDSTREAWSLYQELFGPNQQSRISVIQGDFNHGVEYEGVYFQSRGFFDTYTGTQESYLAAISVHETAHQWWYGQVANDQALEPWLDEALCTFSELAYYEHLYPDSVDWWWYTRVNYYQPEGDLEGSIYSYTEFPDQYLRYRNATYLQGARFFSGLKDEMGEEDFYTFLRDYSQQYQDRIASGADFFSTLEKYLEVSSLVWVREFFPDLAPID